MTGRQLSESYFIQQAQQRDAEKIAQFICGLAGPQLGGDWQSAVPLQPTAWSKDDMSFHFGHFWIHGLAFIVRFVDARYTGDSKIVMGTPQPAVGTEQYALQSDSFDANANGDLSISKEISVTVEQSQSDTFTESFEFDVTESVEEDIDAGSEIYGVKSETKLGFESSQSFTNEQQHQTEYSKTQSDTFSIDYQVSGVEKLLLTYQNGPLTIRTPMTIDGYLEYGVEVEFVNSNDIFEWLKEGNAGDVPWDRFATPENNGWLRRVQAADIHTRGRAVPGTCRVSWETTRDFVDAFYGVSADWQAFEEHPFTDNPALEWLDDKENRKVVLDCQRVQHSSSNTEIKFYDVSAASDDEIAAFLRTSYPPRAVTSPPDSFKRTNADNAGVSYRREPKA